MGKPGLKDQTPVMRTDDARIPSRYAQPQPSTPLGQLCAVLKRTIPILLLAVAAVSVFLAIPFRHWDHYADWTAIQDTLTKLSAKPDSAADMQRLRDAAATADIFRGQPTGPRPEKWAQRFQRLHYDAVYGVAQTAALGIIRHGDAPRGLGELARLAHRTGNASVTSIPSAALLTATATHTPCPTCDGKGQAALNTGFPLKASLRNTFTRVRKLQSKSPIIQQCPTCQGSGTQTKPGRQNANLASSVAGDLSASVNDTLLNIDEGMAFWRPLHTAANAQRAILQSVGLHAQGAPLSPHVGGTAAGADPFAGLRAASEALLRAPKSEPDAQTLANAAKSEDTPPALRSLAMSAYGLSLLMRGNTGTYSRVCAIQKSTFAPPYPAPFFTAADCTTPCEDCKGKGERPYPCPTCMGPNVCGTCKGKGQTQTIDGTAPCSACRNAPICPRCKGRKSVTATCTACRGEKKTPTPNARVQAAYGETLTNLIAYCDAAAEAESQPPLDAPPPRENGFLIPVLILIGAALPAALLLHLTAKWKRAKPFSALPGMQDIDTDMFTDPLSLGAQESRNNVKRKTARIPIPDEPNR